MNSLHENHLIPLNEIFRFQFVDVYAGGDGQSGVVAAVPHDGVFAGPAGGIDKGADALSEDVVYRKPRVRGGRQGKFYGGCGIEGIWGSSASAGIPPVFFCAASLPSAARLWRFLMEVSNISPEFRSAARSFACPFGLHEGDGKLRRRPAGHVVGAGNSI